jgi:hypothetical protein
MTTEQQDLLTIIKNYLKAIEDGNTGDELAIYYSDSVEQNLTIQLDSPIGTSLNQNLLIL